MKMILVTILTFLLPLVVEAKSKKADISRSPEQGFQHRCKRLASKEAKRKVQTPSSEGKKMSAIKEEEIAVCLKDPENYLSVSQEKIESLKPKGDLPQKLIRVSSEAPTE